MKPQEMPRPGGQGPRPKWYGDGNFRGTGAITCEVCKEPIRDHPGVGRCPKLLLPTGTRLTVPAPGKKNNERRKNGEIA